ncbi:hypothetical protein DVA67_032700 [Solirubrobacter sp. CPCC 204708]|uniref:Uncharacterized protein n=1 Tax=Solirubrobacter deserti TaxID=2282478 RepID=A0ABT4RTF8_9ACTN|nr:hypothetical protein [Solirubrobacter deserti]MBE2320765.1 hypothetical protein [Solirubrobacter deserti]MDA0141866.1 hypothetical protein [Solirubrobacter deserti]
MIEMLEMLRGDEDDRFFHAVLETLIDQEDYGAYETVHQTLLRVDDDRRGRLIAEAISGVLERTETRAGDVLGQLAHGSEDAVQAFNAAAALLPAHEKQRLERFIAEQKADGWLSRDNQRGRLRFLSS